MESNLKYEAMRIQDIDYRLEGILSDDSWVMSIKKDGYWYACQRGQFVSRLGTDRTGNVPHLNAVFMDIDAVFAGEIYYPGLKSNNVTKIMGCLPIKAVERQADMGPIHYYLYDLLEYRGASLVNVPWAARRELLEHIYTESLTGYPTIELAEVFYGSEAKHLLFESIRDSGSEEGVVLNNTRSPYFAGAKPVNVIYKWKQEITEDVIITGFKPGKPGKYEDKVGAVLGSMYIDDSAGNSVLTEVCACSGMDDEVRLDITEHPENYLGKVLEVRAMEKTAKRRLRHVAWRRLRDDKPSEDCIWMDI